MLVNYSYIVITEGDLCQFYFLEHTVLHELPVPCLQEKTAPYTRPLGRYKSSPSAESAANKAPAINVAGAP